MAIKTKDNRRELQQASMALCLRHDHHPLLPWSLLASERGSFVLSMAKNTGRTLIAMVFFPLWRERLLKEMNNALVRFPSVVPQEIERDE
jgi:hypothetical protein